jgi:uncharacterized protein (TIGR03437 family)
MTRFLPFLVLSACLVSQVRAQSLVLVSGSGQIQGQQALTDAPLVVQANDANGKPLPGVAITWSVSPAEAGGTPNAELVTGTNGQASTYYIGAVLQPEGSFLSATVTATSKYGSVTFPVTTVPYYGAPPYFQFITPSPGAVLTAAPGSTLPGAVIVQVLAGPGAEAGQGIPNVGVLMVNANNPSIPPAAHCNGPGGVVFTDADNPTCVGSKCTGKAVCDLVVTGSAGLPTSLAADIGDYQTTAAFELNITGTTCTYSISPSSNAITASGGTGSVSVTAGTSCSWVATSNAEFITITSGAAGTGNGTVNYSVGADVNGARTGTLTIAGKTFTVNEGSGHAGGLSITTPANLPGAVVNQSYSATLAASGGIPPYSWSITSGQLPAGLSFNTSTGLISGAATAAGTTTFTATVTDNAGTTASLIFSITISASSSTFIITNTSFLNGAVGQVYTPQPLTFNGASNSIFGAHPIFSVSAGALPDGLGLTVNPDESYSITGTPTATGLFNFTLTATDSTGDTAAASFTITITGPTVQETMGASPGMLAFTVQLGSLTGPAPQTLSITGSTGLLAYTSIAATATGGSWLALQSSAGNTPGTINVSVTNYSSLQPGPYSGTVTISSPASNSPVVVPVTLTVLAAPGLMASPLQIKLSQGQTTGSNPTTQSIQVTAGTGQTSGASIGFSVTATTNKGGNWLSVTPTAATTPATLTATIDSGGLAVGTYPGTITITPTAGSVQLVPVTLNVINPQTLTAAPTSVTFTYPQGTPNPQAQTVTVTSSAGPALSLSTAVTTTDNGNWLSVSPTGGTTPLALSISVNPAGLAQKTYTGTITVSASDDSVTPLPIPVTLTVITGGPNITSVVNAASFVAGPVAPGEFVTIYGSGLGPAEGAATTSTGTISTGLADTQVFFASFFAPILFTSAGQVNVIVPYQLATKSSTNLTVWYKGTASAGDDLRVVDSVPGIFVLNAAGQGAIVNQDGTVNSASNGAAIGSVVSIYATGQGEINPPGVNGAIATSASPQPPPLPVTVEIGGLPATVQYAGSAPGAPDGFMQVNATVPAGVPTGKSVPIVISVGTASSQAGVTIAIHP